MNMKHKACLVITHGHTDLQLLLHDPNDKTKLLRAAPHDDLVRRWHEHLLRELEQGRACVVDLPKDSPKGLPVDPLKDPSNNRKGSESKVTFSHFDNDTYTLRLKGNDIQVSPARNDYGKLQLVLPKIQPALSEWIEKHAKSSAEEANKAAAANRQIAAGFQSIGMGKNEPTIDRVLVLSTDRGSDNQQGANRSSNNQEPIATPAFLKQWFKNKYSLSEEKIFAIDYLGLGEDLEGKSGEKKVVPIHPDIARRLEDALHIFYPPGSEETLLLAREGGLREVKPLLDEYASMLAPGRTDRLGSPERGDAGVLGLTYIDALRTRRICLEHVRRGNLLDAYACAAPFYNEESAKSWVQPLKQAASLINGNPIGSVGSAATLPALQAIIDNAKKASCLLVAVRVESALQGQRWLEAINGSLTFVEAALGDAVGVWVTKQGGKFDRFTRGVEINCPELKKLRGSALEDPPYDGFKYPFQADLVGRDATQGWMTVLDFKDLSDLHEKFYKKGKSIKTKLVDYRHYNTHGVLDQERIDNALNSFMNKDIWSKGLENPSSSLKVGECFLDRELIKAVLQHFLPNSNPAQLYCDLLQELEQCLIQPAQAQGSETRANAAP